MIAVLLIGAAAATAFVLAAAARCRSFGVTLLVAYLAFVGEIGALTLALSPFRWVTRTGLGITEVVLLGGALALWQWRGRPRLPFASARSALREVVLDPVTALFLIGTLVLLAYELFLGFTVPPNNGDAIFYHLPRAAAWAQHGGYFWIPNAPNVELNMYQPFAEQQIFFLFVATKSSVLIALPQFLAEIAILVSVYATSRRIGFGVRPAACAAFLLATFSVFALEAMTAQNDLVAASLIAVAACLLLGEGWLEPALAGGAAGLALGTKLTAGLTVPILAALAIVRGRRTVGFAIAGGIVGFAALGMWSYILNDIHTGHLLGVGTDVSQDRHSPEYPRSVATAFYLMYGMMDLSVISDHVIRALLIAGMVVAVAVVLFRRSIRNALQAALPFVAPMLVIGGAAVIAWIAHLWGFPIRGPGGLLGPLDEMLNRRYTHLSNEDYSAFGPVGIVALLAAIALTIRAYVKRRVDVRHLVLASALPVFLLLVALNAIWVPFLLRFFVLPAVLAAPLLARLFTNRVTTAAYAVAAGLAIGITVVGDQTKQFTNPYGYGHAWNLTQPEALITNSKNQFAGGIAEYDRAVPRHACVGALLAGYEPSYLLYGRQLQHRLFYLSIGNEVTEAIAHNLAYVVIGNGPDLPAADRFKGAGWKITSLGDPWLLATDPHVSASGCTA